MAESFFNRYLVLWSSRESVEAGKISLLAVAEVVFSVTIYWWAAWYFQTHAHLLASVIATPLALLRSDESVDRGRQMFKRYWNENDFGIIKLIMLLCALMTGVYLSKLFVTDLISVEFYDDRPSLRLTTIFMWSMALLIMSGTVVMKTAVIRAWDDFWRWRMSLMFVSLGLALLIVLVAFFAELDVGFLPVADSLVAVILGMLLGGPIGLAVGIVLRAFIVRLWATIRHLNKGVFEFPVNWRRMMFQTDLTCAPEIVPGIGNELPVLEFRNLIKEPFRNPVMAIDSRVLVAILVLILIVPSLFYRYSLKSTCWLYLPLIYVVHLPDRLRDREDRLVWMRALPSKLIQGLWFVLAAITIVVALLSVIDATKLRDLLNAVGAGATPFTIFSFILVLDLWDLRPWHYFTLPSALLTLFLFFWLDGLRKDEKAGATIDAYGWKVVTAIFASRLRNVFVYAWLCLALYYFSEYSYSQCQLPSWMASLLRWQFGDVFCK